MACYVGSNARLLAAPASAQCARQLCFCKSPRSSAAALAGKPISTLILGGSIEAGGDLNNRLDTYFAHVSDWLNDTFPPTEGQHTFNNGGRSSTGSPYFARCAVRVWTAHVPWGRTLCCDSAAAIPHALGSLSG